MSKELFTTDQVAEAIGISRPGVVSRARKLNLFPYQDTRGGRGVLRKMFLWTAEQRDTLIANRGGAKKSSAKGGAWDKELCSEEQACIWCQIKDQGVCEMGQQSTCYKLHMNLYIKGV